MEASTFRYIRLAIPSKPAFLVSDVFIIASPQRHPSASATFTTKFFSLFRTVLVGFQRKARFHWFESHLHEIKFGRGSSPTPVLTALNTHTAPGPRIFALCHAPGAQAPSCHAGTAEAVHGRCRTQHEVGNRATQDEGYLSHKYSGNRKHMETCKGRTYVFRNCTGGKQWELPQIAVPSLKLMSRFEYFSP